MIGELCGPCLGCSVRICCRVMDRVVQRWVVKERELVVGMVGGSGFVGCQKWEKNFWKSCAFFEVKAC